MRILILLMSVCALTLGGCSGMGGTGPKSVSGNTNDTGSTNGTAQASHGSATQ